MQQLRMTCLSICALSTILPFAGTNTALAQESETKTLPPIVVRTSHKTTQALESRSDWAFDETRLQDVAWQLSEKHRVPFSLDRRTLEEAGIDLDTPVSIEVNDITLRSLLGLMVAQLDLDVVESDDEILITTREMAEIDLETRVYPLASLLNVGRAADQTDADALIDEFIPLIEATIEPDSWVNNGGAGALAHVGNSLVVLQDSRTHRVIERFLEALRGMAHLPDQDRSKAVFPDAENNRCRHALSRPISIELENTPLRDVARLLSKACGCNVLLDVRALDAEGIGSDTPVSLRAVDLPLKRVLDRLKREFSVGHAIRYESILLTTPDTDTNHLVIYPIEDIAPVDEDGELDYATVVDAICSTIEPDSWSNAGGSGAIEPCRAHRALVISQIESTHARVAVGIEQLRTARALEKQTVKERTSAEQPAGGSTAQASKEMVTRAYQAFPEIGTVELVPVIVRLLPDVKWDQDGALIQNVGQRLIVHHRRDVHRKVEKILAELHRARTPKNAGAMGGMGGPSIGGGGGGGGLF